MAEQTTPPPPREESLPRAKELDKGLRHGDIEILLSKVDTLQSINNTAMDINTAVRRVLGNEILGKDELTDIRKLREHPVLYAELQKNVKDLLEISYFDINNDKYIKRIFEARALDLFTICNRIESEVYPVGVQQQQQGLSKSDSNQGLVNKNFIEQGADEFLKDNIKNILKWISIIAAGGLGISGIGWGINQLFGFGGGWLQDAGLEILKYVGLGGVGTALSIKLLGALWRNKGKVWDTTLSIGGAGAKMASGKLSGQIIGLSKNPREKGEEFLNGLKNKNDVVGFLKQNNIYDIFVFYVATNPGVVNKMLEIINQILGNSGDKRVLEGNLATLLENSSPQNVISKNIEGVRGKIGWIFDNRFAQNPFVNKGIKWGGGATAASIGVMGLIGGGTQLPVLLGAISLASISGGLLYEGGKAVIQWHKRNSTTTTTTSEIKVDNNQILSPNKLNELRGSLKTKLDSIGVVSSDKTIFTLLTRLNNVGGLTDSPLKGRIQDRINQLTKESLAPFSATKLGNAFGINPQDILNSRNNGPMLTLDYADTLNKNGIFYSITPNIDQELKLLSEYKTLDIEVLAGDFTHEHLAGFTGLTSLTVKGISGNIEKIGQLPFAKTLTKINLESSEGKALEGTLRPQDFPKIPPENKKPPLFPKPTNEIIEIKNQSTEFDRLENLVTTKLKKIRYLLSKLGIRRDNTDAIDAEYSSNIELVRGLKESNELDQISKAINILSKLNIDLNKIVIELEKQINMPSNIQQAFNEVQNRKNYSEQVNSLLELLNKVDTIINNSRIKIEDKDCLQDNSHNLSQIVNTGFNVLRGFAGTEMQNIIRGRNIESLDRLTEITDRLIDLIKRIQEMTGDKGQEKELENEKKKFENIKKVLDGDSSGLTSLQSLNAGKLAQIQRLTSEITRLGQIPQWINHYTRLYTEIMELSQAPEGERNRARRIREEELQTKQRELAALERQLGTVLQRLNIQWNPENLDEIKVQLDNIIGRHSLEQRSLQVQKSNLEATIRELQGVLIKKETRERLNRRFTGIEGKVIELQETEKTKIIKGQIEKLVPGCDIFCIDINKEKLGKAVLGEKQANGKYKLENPDYDLIRTLIDEFKPAVINDNEYNRYIKGDESDSNDNELKGLNLDQRLLKFVDDYSFNIVDWLNADKIYVVRNAKGETVAHLNLGIGDTIGMKGKKTGLMQLFQTSLEEENENGEVEGLLFALAAEQTNCDIIETCYNDRNSINGVARKMGELIGGEILIAGKKPDSTTPDKGLQNLSRNAFREWAAKNYNEEQMKHWAALPDDMKSKAYLLHDVGYNLPKESDILNDREEGQLDYVDRLLLEIVRFKNSDQTITVDGKEIKMNSLDKGTMYVPILWIKNPKEMINTELAPDASYQFERNILGEGISMNQLIRNIGEVLNDGDNLVTTYKEIPESTEARINQKLMEIIRELGGDNHKSPINIHGLSFAPGDQIKVGSESLYQFLTKHRGYDLKIVIDPSRNGGNIEFSISEKKDGITATKTKSFNTGKECKDFIIQTKNGIDGIEAISNNN